MAGERPVSYDAYRAELYALLFPLKPPYNAKFAQSKPVQREYWFIVYEEEETWGKRRYE